MWRLGSAPRWASGVPGHLGRPEHWLCGWLVRAGRLLAPLYGVYATTTEFVILGFVAPATRLALSWPVLLVWLTFPPSTARLGVQRTAGLHFQFDVDLAVGVALERR